MGTALPLEKRERWLNNDYVNEDFKTMWFTLRCISTLKAPPQEPRFQENMSSNTGHEASNPTKLMAAYNLVIEG